MLTNLPISPFPGILWNNMKTVIGFVNLRVWYLAIYILAVMKWLWQRIFKFFWWQIIKNRIIWRNVFKHMGYRICGGLSSWDGRFKLELAGWRVNFNLCTWHIHMWWSYSWKKKPTNKNKSIGLHAWGITCHFSVALWFTTYRMKPKKPKLSEVFLIKLPAKTSRHQLLSPMYQKSKPISSPN